MSKATFAVLTLTIFLLPTPFLLAKDTDLGAPGCGDPDSKFEVRTNKGEHPAQADAGKALVYFIEDDSEFTSHPKPITRIGIDGQWVGANHGNSFFYIAVDPGVHHLCASWQSSVILGQGHKTAAAHFTADAGSIYYFAVKNRWQLDVGTAGMKLNPVDSDEGQLMANKLSLSSFQPKK